jgi:hypothetical protein
MAKQDTLFAAVNEVLLREWDPARVGDHELARDEYHRYARTLCRYLREGADEYRLTSYLSQVERVSMGISGVDEERNRRVARRRLGLVSAG